MKYLHKLTSSLYALHQLARATDAPGKRAIMNTVNGVGSCHIPGVDVLLARTVKALARRGLVELRTVDRGQEGKKHWLVQHVRVTDAGHELLAREVA